MAKTSNEKAENNGGVAAAAKRRYGGMAATMAWRAWHQARRVRHQTAALRGKRRRHEMASRGMKSTARGIGAAQRHRWLLLQTAVNRLPTALCAAFNALPLPVSTATARQASSKAARISGEEERKSRALRCARAVPRRARRYAALRARAPRACAAHCAAPHKHAAYRLRDLLRIDISRRFCRGAPPPLLRRWLHLHLAVAHSRA